MILVFKVLAVIFMIIGIFATFTLLGVAIQGRIERKKQLKRIREAGEAVSKGFEEGIRDVELHNKQLDILSKSLEEHLREKYDIPVMIEDECDGCMLKDWTGADNDHILTCLKCRRSYVEGSDEREEYQDNYIAEEVSGDE